MDAFPAAKNRKPSFTKPLEDVKIQAGEPLKLEALVTAFPIPEVKWSVKYTIIRCALSI